MDDREQRERLEQIDACRVGRPEDLRELNLGSTNLGAADRQELDDWIDRVQQCDGAISRALEDVPVPTGLSSRLLERLAEARAAQAASLASAQVSAAQLSGTQLSGTQPSAAAPFPATLPLAPNQPLTRRRWLRRSAAAALVLGAGGWSLQAWLRQPGAELTDEALWGHFYEIFAQQLKEGAEVRSLVSAPRQDFPICDLNVGASVRGWQPVETLGRAGVCYYLQSAGRQALLWVLPLEGSPAAVPHLATEPLEASRDTGGVTVTVWKAREMLYALAAADATLFVAKSRRLT